MRVLLTGATGFVGAQVARVLAEQGCEVLAVIRPGADLARIADVADRLHLWEGDLAGVAEPRVLASLSPEVCIHLAWYAEPEKYLWAVDENIRSLTESLNLLQALATAGCRKFVAAGSCAEYGSGSPGELIADTASIHPDSPYARAKAAFSLVGQDVAGAAGIEWAWARLFFLYGPWEHPKRVVPSVTRACLRGDVFPATPGEQRRDYLHVRDVATALWAIAASGTEGPVNVCSGTPVSLRSVLEQIELTTGHPGLVKFGERSYLPNEWMWMCGDNSRLQETGWRPSYTSATGIAATVDWWRGRLLNAVSPER